MSNLSLWEQESFYSTQDIIIIGGGFMGLWTALNLKIKNSSLHITILEKNVTPLGASTRNAGFSCFGSPTEIINDIETMGLEETLEIVRMRFNGLERIKSHFSPSQINLDNCGGYELINKDYKYFDQLDEKIEWLNKHLKNITEKENTFVRRDDAIAEKGLMGFDAMIENTLESGLHSGKLVSALIQKVQAFGVTILNGIEVSSWVRSLDGMHVYTKQQIRFTANQLMLCTNAFGNEIAPQLNITPARGQVIVTSEIPGLKLSGTFHFDEGFYYWRNLDGRILIGGARNADFEGERTTNVSGSELIKNKLIDFLKKHFDSTYEYTIENHWSGIMGFTENKKPLLTQLDDNVYAVLACNGMGVALTPIMGEKAADMLLLYF
ncbi:MAG: FAD-binding oxidoreductase [Bacteroidetes bacterium]|nr:FAD-binding oxidoreductase [Bacteroidota bacterium]